MALIEKLKAKGFNLKDLDVKEIDERTVKISKTVDGVTMSIEITFNFWYRSQRLVHEFDFLELDDYYISNIINGTQEQILEGKVASEEQLTEFVKQVVGNNMFNVNRPSEFWREFWHDTFTCVNIRGGITSFIDRSTVGDSDGGQAEISGGSSGLSKGGGRRKKTRRRKYKKKSKKRRKSKRKSKRKPKCKKSKRK